MSVLNAFKYGNPEKTILYFNKRMFVTALVNENKGWVRWRCAKLCSTSIIYTIYYIEYLRKCLLSALKHYYTNDLKMKPAYQSLKEFNHDLNKELLHVALHNQTISFDEYYEVTSIILNLI
jgi:hypothetical protein